VKWTTCQIRAQSPNEKPQRLTVGGLAPWVKVLYAQFMLSPKRDLIAAKLFLRLALCGGGPSPRVINVDGHPAYARAIAELKQTGELSRRCRCRTAPYLNDIIEIVFTQMTKPDLLAFRIGWDYIADLDFSIGHKDAIY
jgi:hypothetical protein